MLIVKLVHMLLVQVRVGSIDDDTIWKYIRRIGE